MIIVNPSIHYKGIMRIVITLLFLFASLSGSAQTILLTFVTFEKTMKHLEGYKVLMINDNNGVYEAMLADEGGNKYLLTIKDYSLCQPYQDGGQKVLLSDREAYTITTPAFSMLSAALPEFMACLHITASFSNASDKLVSLAMKMPFLAPSTGSSYWPDAIDMDCRVPGVLQWVKPEPTSTEGFTTKFVAEIEVSEDTFSWIKNLPCGCQNKNDFADCGVFVLFCQQGKIGELPLKAKIGERLRFTYYFR